MKAPAGTRELIVERLGVRPFLVVEWKQMHRAAGAVELQVQDWTDGSPGGRGFHLLAARKWPHARAH